MLMTLLKRLYQQVQLLVVVSLVLLAAYVSAGRQFMPAVARYTSFFEDQIFALTGVPVRIDSLTGSFTGFNPRIQIDGLRLFADGQQPGPEAQAGGGALLFQQATLIVDVPRSIAQRRWVLADFVVESLELDLLQGQDGAWQFSGMSGGGGDSLTLEQLFQSAQRLQALNLRDVVINVETRIGSRFSLNNGSATILNRGRAHVLHMNANLGQNLEQLGISFEMQGNQLSSIGGQIHAVLPESDYSALFGGTAFAGFEVDELNGGGELWLGVRNGELTSAVARTSVERLALSGNGVEPVVLQNLDGSASLQRGAEAGQWQLALSDMALNWGRHYWRPFNVFFDWMPEQSLTLRADNIHLALVSQLAVASGLLDSASSTQLQQYNPGGALKNFSLHLPLENAADQHLQLSSNLDSVQLGSVNGSPSMWGINGYFDLDFDRPGGLITGVAEVESDEFSINIPSVFTAVWDYSFVNGRLDFQVDLSNGQRVQLVSSPIVVESDAVDGRARFTSIVHDFPDGQREAELELLVGAERVDAQLKSLYLPDGTNIRDNLRASMEWLDTAILDGEVYDSGVIYRGSTVQGSAPETKTFQSFYQLRDGALNFSDEWPDLSALAAYVSTDDNNIDIEVSSGSSLGIEMAAVSGTIRRNGQDENWLDVTGRARGATASGLDYLQQAPLEEGLRAAFADWQSSGGFVADIGVRVPLDQPGRDPDVRLAINVQDNTLEIPAYAIEVSQLSGPVLFDTRTGLEDSELEGRMFDYPVQLALSSEAQQGEISSIRVDAVGAASRQALLDWPLQSEFVRSLLTRMDGAIEFQASLSLPQGRDARRNALSIDSDLAGARLDLPYPFTKSAASRQPLHLDLEFGADETVAGTLGSILAFELALSDGELSDGVVYVGEDAPSDLSAWNSDAVTGLAVVGELDRLPLQEWTDFLAAASSSGSPSADFSESVAFVDIRLGLLEVFGQQFQDVTVRIEPDLIDQGWLTRLTSEAVQGWVTIPYRADDYLQLDLEYLRLPGEEEEPPLLDPDTVATRELEPEEEREDPLLAIDPRQLPRLKFASEQFMLGSRDYGSWQFTLDPHDEGAAFTDLVFDFRGLRLGLDGEVPIDEQTGQPVARYVPYFDWRYDGEEHRSVLRGILHANNMAEVLRANGYAASFESDNAVFYTDVNWPGSPAFFAASDLSGEIYLEIEDGRFLQNAGGPGALKLISIINLDAIMRRLRFSDDLLRRGLAYEEISARVLLEDGLVNIEDQLVISGPSSVYQITGQIDLAQETISGEMYVTLPVSDNIPWLGLVTGNLPLALGAYLFDRIFGAQVDSLTSAVYTLEGPWEGLQPQFKQAFGSPGDGQQAEAQPR